MEQFSNLLQGSRFLAPNVAQVQAVASTRFDSSTVPAWSITTQ
jgi:hypothetical protein